MDLGFDIVDSVRGLDFESDGFAREAVMQYQVSVSTSQRIYERLYKDLHLAETDALVCPTNSTMESSTKARAGVDEESKKVGRSLRFINPLCFVSVDGPCASFLEFDNVCEFYANFGWSQSRLCQRDKRVSLDFVKILCRESYLYVKAS